VVISRPQRQPHDHNDQHRIEHIAQEKVLGVSKSTPTAIPAAARYGMNVSLIPKCFIILTDSGLFL